MFPGYGQAEQGTPTPRAAAVRTRSIFGLKVPERKLRAFAGGLAAPQSEGFLGGLMSGLGGSLQGGMQYDQQMKSEDERREIAEQKMLADELERRDRQTRLGLDERRVVAEEQRLTQPDKIGKQKEYEFLVSLGKTPEEAYQSVFGSTEGLVQIAGPGGPTWVRQSDAVGQPAPVHVQPEPLVQIAGPDGAPMYAPRSQAVGKKLPRERSLIKGQERTALAFYNRAKDAEDTIGPLEGKIASMPLPSQFQLRFAPNVMQSSDQQVYRQSQRAFTEARLRKESGAAIPTAEYENDSRTYFAQPGDTPETIERKRAARQMVLNGLKFSSGQAYEEYYGEPNTPPGRAANAGGAAQPGDVVWTKVNGKWVRSQ
jgi:hypothetical protein